MSAQPKRLGSANDIVINTFVTFYTVPVGKVAILTNITQSGSTNAIMGIAMNGNGYLWDSVILNRWSSRATPVKTVMKAGEILQAYHTAASQYTMVFGVEMDAADAPLLHRVDLLSVEGPKSYTVPTAKRFRVREVVVCSHATSPAGVSMSISGIGYIFETPMTANQPAVISTDMSVNAGEIISASATSGSVHCFVSGVLEDA